jgi:hypothetical protein
MSFYAASSILYQIAIVSVLVSATCSISLFDKPSDSDFISIGSNRPHTQPLHTQPTFNATKMLDNLLVDYDPNTRPDVKRKKNPTLLL